MTNNSTQDTEDVVDMIYDLRDPLLQLAYHYRERIAETLIELNNRALECQSLSDRIDGLTQALGEIAKGEGAFNRDPLIHAENTIENMKELARAALHQEGIAP